MKIKSEYFRNIIKIIIKHIIFEKYKLNDETTISISFVRIYMGVFETKIVINDFDKFVFRYFEKTDELMFVYHLSQFEYKRIGNIKYDQPSYKIVNERNLKILKYIHDKFKINLNDEQYEYFKLLI